jgi:hypothetical protein
MSDCHGVQVFLSLLLPGTVFPLTGVVGCIGDDHVSAKMCFSALVARDKARSHTKILSKE